MSVYNRLLVVYCQNGDREQLFLVVPACLAVQGTHTEMHLSEILYCQGKQKHNTITFHLSLHSWHSKVSIVVRFYGWFYVWLVCFGPLDYIC